MKEKYFKIDGMHLLINWHCFLKYRLSFKENLMNPHKVWNLRDYLVFDGDIREIVHVQLLQCLQCVYNICVINEVIAWANLGALGWTSPPSPVVSIVNKWSKLTVYIHACAVILMSRLLFTLSVHIV